MTKSQLYFQYLRINETTENAMPLTELFTVTLTESQYPLSVEGRVLFSPKADVSFSACMGFVCIVSIFTS